MILLSLFLYIGVDLVACDENQLIFKNDTNINIDFFNIHFYNEEERNKACRYLKEANIIELEEEKLVQNAYYIYVDGKLLQEIAIDNNWAKVNMNYPEYIHQLEKDEMVISNISHIPNTNNHSIWILSILFLLNIFLFLLVSKM